ncbi:MAG: aminotransferase class I/II-fold pyridoxal phosphate-dependent enzyme [Chloroflexi bacterium]|nr:aminotransferase class I/II-fold pyridoxal phosphate-dependent enzyme [Chloroflexota bacterium]MCI0577449.1 aminotransferase class I/II-fold pyridoxal phosphate-dependent enzyme [Chloroflexota bacterium]MCI0647806.1 aminotransferase class I/II-fold pyridoxal phosphate-dependent enzyme [Chloroflexota bacterium]MCI0728992.1 aminotransferase class I/II-fold pyridoxal phosphate-dependent enzyme [Chloroflexota bacterium]
MPPTEVAVHDPTILAQARAILDACRSGQEMQQAVLDAVQRNETWRGRQCINLLAPEAPTSPTVRALLASEIGTRAAEGHIGVVQRWFAGTKYIDEVEALCVELLKQAFNCRYADHRLMGSMLGNMAVYYALAEPGDVIMTVAQPFGGHSSNRADGPAGQRGLKIVDIPFDPVELTVDLELFRKMAPLVKPKLITLGLSMTLFPLPVREMKDVIQEWGGRLFFDGAHQAGLIAGGQFQDPLAEGADVLTGSAGKTFGGPQSGMMMWNDPALTVPLTQAVFPVLAATHQVNRVAALAVSAAEMIAFGRAFMAQIVRNAQALAAALDRRGIPILGKHKGYTATHQVIANVRQMGGGLDVAHLLARANMITNKNLLPHDAPEAWDRPSGLRLGTIEVTRLGMKEPQMDQIAEFMARVLVEKEPADSVLEDVIEFRQPYQTLYYCFDNGLPA